MMRPFTFLCMLAAAGSGFYLFQTKNQAMLLDREIQRTMKQTEEARQRAMLLRAEFARLNDPDRLQELATQLLPSLRPTDPKQFTTLAELDKWLPPVGAPMPAAPLEPQAPDAQVPHAAPPALSAPPVSVPVATAPARSAPPRTDQARPEPVRPDPPRAPLVATVVPRPAALPVPHPAPVAAPVSVAGAPTVRPAEHVASIAPPARPEQLTGSAVAARRQTGSVLAIAAEPRPPVAHVMPAVVRGGALPATPTEAVARTARGAAVNPAVPAVTSALGMARTMVPSPIAPAQAGTLAGGGLR
jgi:hypothetical protein